MADNLELKVVFAAVDKFLRPVNAITKGARAASKELKATKDAVKALGDQQRKIDSFRSTNKALGIDTRRLDEARQFVKRLADEMAATAGPSVKMQRAFAEAKKEAAQLSANVGRLTERKHNLRRELAAVGIDTKQLAAQQRDLKSRYDQATDAVNRQSAALDAENRKMQRLKAAQADLAKSRDLSRKMTGAGTTMLAGGIVTGLPVVAAAKAYADFETAMLGVARQVDGAKDANGKYTQTYFEMAEAVKAMSERLPMTASDIAAIVEAGARMGIQGKQNLLTFAETTAVMATAFDLPVDQVGEDVSKIANLYKVPIKDIKALGDTINYLDDNALSKGGDIIEVMKRIAGTADLAKMSFGQAAALGSTYLSLGSTAEVAASASNAMIRELSIANMQSDRFMSGLDMLQMKAADVQLGMNKDSTGTIIKVLEAIKALPEAQQLEAATSLFGKEFGDDAAKLASNLAEYRKQLALVNDERAGGSMQRESDTRNNSINARMDMAKNALSNLTSDLGETMRPALVNTLEEVLSIAQAIRAWSNENPQLASGLISVVKWLAIGLTLMGGITLAAGAILGPLAMARFAFTALGISGSGAMSVLGAGFSLIMKGIGGIGTVLIRIAMLAMAHPIIALIALIAAGAMYIWNNWDTLGPKFFALIDRISSYFGNLKDRAIEAGRNMIDGMISGITSRWTALKETVGGIGDKSIDWVKDKLGIHSPSRVFAELGGFTMQGFAQGLAGGADGAFDALTGVSRRLAAIGAGVVIAGSAAAVTSAPAGAAEGALGAPAGSSPMKVEIHIHGYPGQGVDDIQRQVEQALDNIERRRQARSRSRLRDTE